MKTDPARRLAGKLPPDGARDLDAKIEAAQEQFKVAGRPQLLLVEILIDEHGVWMEVPPAAVDAPRRYGWRSAVDGGPIEEDPKILLGRSGNSP